MRLMSLTRALLALALAAGCAPENHGARERLCAGSGCSQTCRDLRVEACNIRDQECLDVIFQSLQCVRGETLDKTPRLTLRNSLLQGTRDVPDEAVQPGGTMSPMNAATTSSATVAPAPADSSNFADSTPSPGVAVLTPQQVAERAHDVFSYYIDEGLRLLHFIPEATTIDDVIEKEEEDVGGFQTGGEVFIEPENVGHRWLSMQLVAHEFVHAQQEVDYGGIANLYTYYPNTTTSRQSIKALIEGEADLYALLTHAFMRNSATDDWALAEYFDEHARTKRREIADMAAPWTHADWWLHYSVGASVLAARWQSGGNLAVRAVHHNLEPDFGIWVRNFAALRGTDLGKGVTCDPERRQMIVRDELGPSGVFALMMAASRDRLVKPVEPAWQIARSLVDDKLDFFAPLLPEQTTQSAWFAEAAQQECRRAQAEAAGAGSSAGASVDTSAASDASVDTSAASDAGVGTSAASDASVDGSADAEVVSSDPVPSPNCADGGVPNSGDFADDPAIPYVRLLPQGSVWLSWRFAFNTASDAEDFVEYFEDLDWQTLEVTRQDTKVLLKGYRKQASEAERALFEAWDPMVTCDD